MSASGSRPAGYQSPRSAGLVARHDSSSSTMSSPRQLHKSHSGSQQQQQQQQQAKPLDLGPLEPFLKTDFDVTAFTRDALRNPEGADASLRSLKSHLETVEHAISSHVVTHEDSLLGTLEAVGSLKREMARGKNDSSALLVSLTRVENEFNEPLERLQNIGLSLSNAHDATGVLRRLAWFLVARKKLRSALEEHSISGDAGAVKEASKAAQLIAELEELLNEGGLKGVTLVDADVRWIKEVGQKVRQDAQKALEKAIVSLNQGEMGMALQAFYHLGVLEDRVNMATIWAAKEFSQEARDALKDINSGSGSVEANQRIQALRTRTDALLERSLRSWALRVWNLQRVLTKKRDPTTHVLFSDVVKIDVFELFWSRATAALEQELKTCSRWVREALIDDYARLRRSARAMLGRLWTSTSSVTTSATASAQGRKLAVGGMRETQALMQAFHPFLSEYLARSLARLNQPVTVMFPEEEPARGLRHVEPRPRAIPTANDVTTFAQIINKELTAVKGDPELLGALAKACAVAVSLFCEKSEAMVSKADAAHAFRLFAPELAFSTSSASAVPISSTSRNSVQEQNVSILALVSLLSTKLREVVENVNATNSSTDSGSGALSAIPSEVELSRLPGMDDLSDDGEIDDEIARKATDDENQERDLETNPSSTSVGTSLQQAVTSATSSSTKLDSARQQLDQLITDILDDYVTGENCFRALDDLLNDVNMENYNVSEDASHPHNFCAKFIKASRTLREEHWSKLPAKDIVCQEACGRFCLKLFRRFLLRASCVRPLSTEGRKMLLRDMHSVVETIIAMNAAHGTGKVDAMKIELSGFERMIIGKEPVSLLVHSGVIRKLLAWHHLFSNAPADVHSPHTRANLSITQYVAIIENESEEMVWPYIVACLNGKDPSIRRPFNEF